MQTTAKGRIGQICGAALGLALLMAAPEAGAQLRGTTPGNGLPSDPVAAWEAYKLQRQQQGLPVGGETTPAPTANYSLQPPTRLTPSQERALAADLRRLNDEDRLAVELLAERTYARLTTYQRDAMQATARGAYAAAGPSQRAQMTNSRRYEYRVYSPAERSAWRYSGGGSYRGLVDGQRNIFRARALESFDGLPSAERANLTLTASRLLDQREKAAETAARGGAVRSQPARATDPAIEGLRLTSEEQMRFRAMTPEQQQQYLQQLGARR